MPVFIPPTVSTNQNGPVREREVPDLEAEGLVLPEPDVGEQVDERLEAASFPPALGGLGIGLAQDDGDLVKVEEPSLMTAEIGLGKPTFPGTRGVTLCVCRSGRVAENDTQVAELTLDGESRHIGACAKIRDDFGGYIFEAPYAQNLEKIEDPPNAEDRRTRV